MAFITGGGLACSGTVVSPNVVLTAGHCVVDDATGAMFDPSSFRVYTGAVDPSTGPDTQSSGVSQILVAPGFNLATLGNDAALLILSTSTTAPSIRVATSTDQGFEAAGTGAYIAGWGSAVRDGPMSEVLQWASTVVQSPAYCGQWRWKGAGYLGSGLQLCARHYPYNDTSTCGGDSGGPLLAYDQKGVPVVEIGITSWGPADCSQGTTIANFFTLVRPLSGWIQSAIYSAVPPPTVATGPSQQVSRNGASVTGSINPNGAATTYRFDYGTSSSYRSQTAIQDAGAGTSPVSVSASLTGLAPGTTYHYRLQATNHTGTRYGADATFTTSKLPQRITLAIARNASGQIVRTRTGKRPQGLTVKCSRVDKTKMNCRLAWHNGNTSYTMRGALWTYISRHGTPLVGHNLKGTRTIRTCSRGHRCKTKRKQVRWIVKPSADQATVIAVPAL